MFTFLQISLRNELLGFRLQGCQNKLYAGVIVYRLSIIISIEIFSCKDLFWHVCWAYSVSARREGSWKDEDVVSRLHGNNTRYSIQGHLLNNICQTFLYVNLHNMLVFQLIYFNFTFKKNVGLMSGKRPCTEGGRAGRGKLLSFVYMDLQLCSLVFFIFFLSVVLDLLIDMIVLKCSHLHV